MSFAIMAMNAYSHGAGRAEGDAEDQSKVYISTLVESVQGRHHDMPVGCAAVMASTRAKQHRHTHTRVSHIDSLYVLISGTDHALAPLLRRKLKATGVSRPPANDFRLPDDLYTVPQELKQRSTAVSALPISGHSRDWQQPADNSIPLTPTPRHQSRLLN